jgi:branched-chain amino acid aminotransferase
VTPTLESNVLPGITRATVIALAQEELGLKVEERVVDRSELYTAEEVFLSGTAAHIQGVGLVDKRPVGKSNVGPVTRKLQDLYFSIVRGNNPAYLHQSTVAVPRVTAR